jgi:hypothetical protein
MRGDHAMHSDEEVEAAARRFEQWADELDPDTAVVESAEELQAVAEAAETARRDEEVLAERVAAARAGAVLEPDCPGPWRIPAGSTAKVRGQARRLTSGPPGPHGGRDGRLPAGEASHDCHVDKAAVVALEGDGDGGGGPIAVLGHDEVRLPRPWGLPLVGVLPVQKYDYVRVLLN